MCIKTSTVYLCLVYFTSVFLLDVNTAENCPTPDKLLGECIAITECAFLKKFLLEMPKTNENINYLRQFHCGFEGRVPKVCCPLKDTGMYIGNRAKVAQSKNDVDLKDLLPSRDICGIHTLDRIVGGETTGITEFPWMALLQYQTPNGKAFKCGGMLINNRYVLTAAHCVLNRFLERGRAKVVSVRLGEYNLEQEIDCLDDTPGFSDCADEPIDVGIEEIIPHELFNTRSKNQSNDIALIRLSKEVPYSDFILPVCLPIQNETASPWLLVAGWGTTEDARQSAVKQKTDLPLVPTDECSKVYKTTAGVEIGDSQICAGGVNKKDSCRGDSGSPLMTINRTSTRENVIAVGIVSFGVSCGVDGIPGVYTRISSYISWILEHLRK